MTEAQIRERLTACGIPCDASLAERLRCYFALLMDWNTWMNLTRITGEEEALDAHFVDSLIALTVPGLIPQQGSLIDVGTGAGFPGMVLALAEDEGFIASGVPSPTLGGWNTVRNYGRETIAWMKYLTEKLFGIEIHNSNFDIHHITRQNDD